MSVRRAISVTFFLVYDIVLCAVYSEIQPLKAASVFNKISCQLSVPRVNEAAACGWFAAERGRLQRISIDSWYAAHALSKNAGSVM